MLYSISWFCLWNISRYLTSDLLLAGLLLPSGLKLAVYALTPRQQWPLYIISELILIGALLYLIDQPQYEYLLILFSLFAYWMAIPFNKIWQPLNTYWQKLLALTALTLSYGFVCGLATLLLIKPLGLDLHYVFEATIATITGGVLLAPFLYLLYDYLHKQIWQPLSPTLIHQEVTLRSSALLWCLLFFSVGLIAELTLLDQVQPLALLIFLLPNIFMAYRYGWQGGVLASMMNSILLATARQVTGSFDRDLELQTFTATQALVGLGLGIAISRQYLLAQRLKQANHKLAAELESKQQLARQLVHVEENIRKSVARELHDEIGQNITAIQIQSMLAKRLASDARSDKIADTINQLAMRIHASTRQLLTQLRPHALDELGLENAIRRLAEEMKFSERHIRFHLNFGIFAERLDEITSVTLYRIVQELLNNVCKHSHATEVKLSLVPGDLFSLELRDNGCGLPSNWQHKGQGLRGIEERVSALGGHMSVDSAQVSDLPEGITTPGTRIIVNLPTKPTGTSPN
ncbi:signal transduction histidine-protein kinase/phosphatase UhpB [Vibrio mediterranei]|uniref:signal transduction histidine-protein kinase/phosphatase UhpB n=1 Tax=Vibrio mediterranei TaxID=689 RepID=UPI00228418AF|nr:signal transduction histidine-protein kinase/phosphatase UhpB [Vibrio mediterranei]MCY9856053.1 signal transduction histidine-protein kinase/phosphatase UhpB [Vibrio mediterranei]